MKKLFLLLSLCVCMTFFSCSNKVYPVSTLESNYELRMTSKSELEAKNAVSIFYKESDVPVDYEVLSVNLYSPWLAIPIICPRDKQIKKKLLQKAVKTAYSEGANGVIILTGSHYKAIKMSK